VKTISVAIATYNEEENIAPCLVSVSSWVDEIILVDGGSQDKTVGIAKRFGAHVISSPNPPIFHLNKQKAVEACSGKWILQLDADEIVSGELQREIYSITVATERATRDGYFIPRKNFFCGHWLRKGGQFPDYVIRLFKRGKGAFPCKSVHEQIQIAGSVGYLHEPLTHNTYRSVSEYWRKADAYTSLAAHELLQKNIFVTMMTILEYNVMLPIVTFVNLFVRHKGFIDGWYGLLFALFSALHYPIAFQKYLHIRHKGSKKIFHEAEH